MILPDTEKSGVVKVSTPIIPKGIANHNKYGLNLPHFVFVLSEIIPIKGSLIESQTLVTNIMVAAGPADIP
jgi:hypothetical protein